MGAKRRRSKLQIKMEKEQEEQRLLDIEVKLASIAESERKLQQLDHLKEENEQKNAFINELILTGVLKQEADGSLSPVKNR